MEVRGISLKVPADGVGGDVVDGDVAGGVDGDAEVVDDAGVEGSDPFGGQGDAEGVTESHEFSDCDWEAIL